MKSERGCLTEMMDVYQKRDGNVVALEQVPMEETHKYGVVQTGGEQRTDSHEIIGMIEKPEPGKAPPSDLILSGRYILQPEIFDYLALQPPGSGNEIQLTDAMIRLNNDQNFSGFQFKGQTFDCGSKSGFLMANVAFGMLRDDIAPNVAETIRSILDDYDMRVTEV